MVENVVTAIERSLMQIPGAKVVPNASLPEKASKDFRQVDVYLEIPAGPRELRVGIEVSDKSRKLTKPQVEQLITKLKALDIDQGCIVSRSGFAKEAIELAGREGVDLKTIQEIERPRWGAEHITFDLTETEPLRADFCFAESSLAEAMQLLDGENLVQVELEFPDGRKLTMGQAVVSQGPRVVGLPEFAHVKDGDIFNVRIYFKDARFTCGKGLLPPPEYIFATYRMKRRTELVPTAAYEHSDGVTALTAASSIFGKQVTMIAQPHDNDTHTLMIAMAEPTPKKSKLTKRDRTAKIGRTNLTKKIT